MSSACSGSHHRRIVSWAEVQAVKVPVLMLLALISSGCATTGLEALSDYDHSQDFSHYKTFAWMEDDPVMGTRAASSGSSPLNRGRTVEAIQTELERKGYRKVDDRGAADFVVAYSIGARDRLDVESYPVPYRGPWLWDWYAGRETEVRTYTEGVLAIDIFDAAKKSPVWHGWASKQLTAQDVRRAAEGIPDAVRRILQRFPPA
jgi:hypothetical protein